MEIELPDGTILDAPDDADPSVVAKAYLAKQRGPQRPYDPFADPPPLPGSPEDEALSARSRPMEEAYDTLGNQAARYFKGINQAAGDVNRAKGSGLLGMGETALTMGTGLIATPVSAITGAILGESPQDEKRIAEESLRRLTYSPHTEQGKAQLGLVSALASPLTESGADIALGPILASESQVVRSASRVKPKKSAPIPTTEELRQAKKAAYDAGNAAEVLTSPEQNAAAITKIDQALRAENLVVDPDLHPKSTALLRRLHGQKDQPLTVPEAESLRQLALEVQRDIDPVTKQPTADAFRAGIILDELDDSLDTLSVNKPARELNARYRRSQLIDEMVHRAEIKGGAHYTQAGMEHALRQEFKQLALNPRRMRGLTQEQRAAVEKVAKGGPIENSLRNIGKFDPSTGGMAAFTGGTLGLLSGGPMGLAIPAAGFIGKRAATRMTGRNVDRAREALVGRGLPEEMPAAAAEASTPANVIEGELMPRTPLGLPAPSMIASSRSAPGTAFAREEMGMTPDVERAGALHPGVARETLTSGAPELPNRAQVPTPQLALPNRAAPAALEDKRPMIVDAQGRVAPNSEKLREYLRVTGQDRMRNVQQPRAEPNSRPLGLATSPLAQPTTRAATRSVAEIEADLKRVDAKAQKLPESEPLDSPRMQALAAEWAQYRDELARAVSASSAQKLGE